MFSTRHSNPLASVVCRRAIALMVAVAFYFSGVVQAADQLMLRDICRLKGLEENTLQGMG